MDHEPQEQHVCLVCGYHMIGYFPTACPFCGASRSQFITATSCSERFKVVETVINDTVSRLSSSPSLGLEHAAYRIKTKCGEIWIDCPSTFDPDLTPPAQITFSHHHFLGASNLYQTAMSSTLRIHRQDSQSSLCRGYSFDQLFEEDHKIDAIEAYHIAGHTPGFTCYFHKETLFICDYVFYHPDKMIYNPYSPPDKIKEGGKKLMEILAGRPITTVCGFNYVTDFDDWILQFKTLLAT